MPGLDRARSNALSFDKATPSAAEPYPAAGGRDCTLMAPLRAAHQATELHQHRRRIRIRVGWGAGNLLTYLQADLSITNLRRNLHLLTLGHELLILEEPDGLIDRKAPHLMRFHHAFQLRSTLEFACRHTRPQPGEDLRQRSLEE